MSEPSDSASEASDSLFARARSGDQTAWRELFETCSPKVLRAVRRKLKSQSAMRSLYDSTDFLGDVWKSLAEKPERFDFPTMDALLAFLSVAAQRKVVDEYRRLHTQKNDIERERPIGAWGGYGSRVPDLPSSDPSPSQVVVADEARDRLGSGLSETERAIIELKRDAYSNQEIGQRTGWSLRKVQRFLKDLSDSWTVRSAGGRP